MVRLGRIFFVVAGCLCASPAFSGDRLEITGASWKEERAELRIEGLSDRVDDVVLLRDAGTRKLIGSAAVRADGKWLLRIKEPGSVPVRLTATCGRATKECEVRKAQ